MVRSDAMHSTLLESLAGESNLDYERLVYSPGSLQFLLRVFFFVLFDYWMGISKKGLEELGMPSQERHQLTCRDVKASGGVMESGGQHFGSYAGRRIVQYCIVYTA